ncbi:penicillin-binding protein activator LpoB [Blochmannia endosymbiont of Colobopsis nipponica]|uniref:penicillin-binding protein activator LpoB n=1 Tax=Blochmannia endosymbiont of Colobopsis nipponica TaxID=2681987 RepID=UPI0017829B59|nr:penicillin-binding protein activator LpoB [Blochmannia endosymbiont of Colobopsis nipponica]QOI11055.1 penicillin-binding protein activator LpoB [Blochmannia endosymbiont of Colobopsis nipponica]
MLVKIKLLFFIVINLFFTSFSNLFFQNSLSIVKVHNQLFDYVSTFTTNALNIIPILPKIKSSDWEYILLPIIKQMFFVNDLEHNSLVLIKDIKNIANGDLQSNEITTALIRIVTKSGKFHVIEKNKLNEAYITLGLSLEDSLEHCSKDLGLGRYLKAKYLLYGVLTGDARQPFLELQLILVKTGEILWCYKEHI